MDSILKKRLSNANMVYKSPTHYAFCLFMSDNGRYFDSVVSYGIKLRICLQLFS